MMPSNYVVADVMPKEPEIKKLLGRAVPVLKEFADSIGQETNIQNGLRTPKAGIKSGLVNTMFNKLLVSSREFRTSEACTGCGRCGDVCPVNNITIENHRPVFHGKCLNCYACIQRCPSQAINIGDRTQEHGRYVCPEYKKFSSEENK